MKRGMQGYATIVRELQKRPMTANEVGRRVDGYHRAECIRRAMAELRKHSIVRVAGWRRENGAHLASAVFGIAGLPDVPQPFKRPRQTAAVRPSGVEMLSFVAIFDALDDEQRSGKELVEISGVCRSAVLRLLRHMRSIGLAHIAGWDGEAPLYRLGDRPDAARPDSKANDALWLERRKRARRSAHLQAVAFALAA